jgi:RND family efflux transporter MFP subunit
MARGEIELNMADTTKTTNLAMESQRPSTQVTEADERSEAAARRRLRLFVFIVFAVVTSGVAMAVLRNAGVFGGSSDFADGPKASDKAMVVRTALVTQGSLSLYLNYSGELTADAANLSFKVSGRIEKVIPRIGDTVKKGDLLARVDDRNLRLQRQSREAGIGLAQAQKAQAEAQLSLARSELSRTLPLAEKKLVAEQAIDELKANVAALEAEVQVGGAEVAKGKAETQLAAQQISDAKLMAPFDGVVTERYLDPGALVQPGSHVLRLIAVDSLRVKFRIPERDLGAVAPEQKISLTVQATEDRVYRGHVTRIAGEVSKTDRSAAAEATIDDKSPVLKSGMYANITIAEKTLEDVLLVPSVAVLTRSATDGSEKSGVFVLDGNTARWMSVEILGRDENRTALSGSLAPGVPVIILGHEQLSDGDKVIVSDDVPIGSRPRAETKAPTTDGRP